MKSLAQILQGTVDARSDGVEFAAEKSGNFLILQFLKAAREAGFLFFPPATAGARVATVRLPAPAARNPWEEQGAACPARERSAEETCESDRCARCAQSCRPRRGKGCQGCSSGGIQDTEEYVLDKVFAQRPVARQLRIEIEERRLVAIKHTPSVSPAPSRTWSIRSSSGAKVIADLWS